jgi:hypothetical protein
MCHSHTPIDSRLADVYTTETNGLSKTKNVV